MDFIIDAIVEWLKGLLVDEMCIRDRVLAFLLDMVIPFHFG